MIKDICKSIVLLAIMGVLALFIYLAPKKGCEVTVIILSAVMALLVEKIFHSMQDITDCNSWKKEQRKYERGHFIRKDTLIRVSFAYLFRIKIDGKYLLVKNGRNTGKNQPVGGVYKMSDSEKRFLEFKYGCMDDDKICVDKSSQNDYRLRIKSRYLRAFVRRFNKGKDREAINNLSREFREELIDTGILSFCNFKKIKYEYVGRYYDGVRYSQHFGCYELLLGDVVSLIPTPEQEEELRNLLHAGSGSKAAFFTDEQISKLGVEAEHGILEELIADHATNVLESKVDSLERAYKRGAIYEIEIETK